MKRIQVLVLALLLTAVCAVGLAAEDVAKNGDYKYTSLSEAIRVASNGETVTLLKDFSENGKVNVKKQIILDLNGWTYTNGSPSDNDAIYVSESGNLTIKDSKGGGGITSSFKSVFNLSAGASLAIENGNFSSAQSVGTFSTGSTEGTSITIKGGTFKLINNTVSSADTSITNNYIAEGYTLDENGSVVQQTSAVAQIGETKYLTLAEAIEAATALSGDQTILLLDDYGDDDEEMDHFELDDSGDRTITFDMGGHTMMGQILVYDGALIVKNGISDYLAEVYDGTLTIAEDAVIQGNGVTAHRSSTLNVYGQIVGEGVLANDNSNVNVYSPALLRDSASANEGIDFQSSGTLTIEGGEISQVRVPGNDPTIVITGGEIDSVEIWQQDPNHKTSVTISGTVSIKDLTISTDEEDVLDASISGGTFTGNVVIEGVTGIISGGTFTAELDEEYLAEGVNYIENEDGTYSVEDLHVAQIGETKYVTLKAAAAAVQDDQTITMLAASEETEEVVFDKSGASFTLDLAGYTVRVDQDLWVKNGNLTITSSAAGGKIVDGQNDAAVYVSSNYNNCEASLTIASDNVTITGGQYGIAFMSNATLNISAGTIEGTCEESGKESFGISGNGNSTGAAVTISGTAKVTGKEVGIYFPGKNSLTISGGTITGATAVYQKSGTLNITGGTLIGNGAKADYSYNGNGANATGDALVIDSCGYPGGAPAATINGGTFSSTNGVQVASYSYGEESEGVPRALANVVAQSDSLTAPDGEKWVKNESGTYTLVKVVTYAITVVDGIENGNVVTDKEMAEEGETVTLAATPEAGYMFDAWIVTKEDGTAVTVSEENTFEMPSQNVTITATFNAVAPIQYYNTWSANSIYYFTDEDPIPTRTTQATQPKIKREGESSYHDAETWVDVKWTVTDSTATVYNDPAASIATVDANGLVTFTAPGTVKLWITMTDPSGAAKSASKTVSYKLAPAYIVRSGEKVAYPTLLSAFNAAQNDETIVMGADYAANNIGKMTLSNNRSITIDLNGFTADLTANYRTDAFGALFTVSKGTLSIVNSGTTGGVTAHGTNARAFNVDGTANSAATDAVLNIGSGVNVSSATDCCVTVFGKGTVNTAGNLSSPADFAIAGNGSSGNEGTVINVTGGSVTGDEVAIYQPQKGELNISGGTITGKTAVYVKSGTVNITGGTLVGNGTAAAFTHNGNGANATGDALVVENTNYPGGAPSVSITAGTFTSTNGKGIGSYADEGNNVTELASIHATGDSITVPDTEMWVASTTTDGYDLVEAVIVTFDADNGSEVTTQKIQKGTTAAKPEDPTKEGYTFGGWYLAEATEAYDFENATVTSDITLTAKWTEAEAKIGDVYYATLAYAIAAAADGDTVTLLKDATANFSTNKRFTLDLGGKTLTADTDNALTVTAGNVTIQNGSIASSKLDFIHAKTGGTIILGTGLSVNGSNGAVIYADDGTVIVDGAEIVSAGEYVTAAVEGENAKLEVKNGSISSSTCSTISVYGNGNCEISGGTVSTTASEKLCAVFSHAGGKVTVSGGEITAANNYALIAASNGSLEVTGGTITGAEGYCGILVHESAGASAAISGGTINGFYSKVGTTTISGGTFTGPVYTEERANLTVSDGLFAESVAEKYMAENKLCTTTLKDENGYYYIVAAVTVTFDVDGVTESENVPKGEKVTKPEDPTKENYSFGGWFAEGAEEAFDFNAAIEENLTLAARWTPDPYQLIFTDGLGNALKSVDTYYGQSLTAEQFANYAAGIGTGIERKGYMQDSENLWSPALPTEETTIEKTWIFNLNWIKVHTVTFKDGDDTFQEPVFVKNGETVVQPETDPTKEGYTFKGWLLNGAEYNFSTPVGSDLTLIAEWVKNKYTVTFDTAGGSGVAAKTVEHGETVTKPTDPEKSGYIFQGWFLGDAEYSFDTQITDNITLTAKWTEAEAKIGDVYYAMLADAIAAAADGDTVTLLANATATFSASKSFTLDLSGKTLTVNKAEGVQAKNGGNVTVKNGAIVSDQDDIISANGGTITLGKDLSVACSSSVIYAYNGGKVIIDGAAVSSTSTAYVAAYAEGEGSSIVLNSGKLTSSGNNAAAAKEKAVVTINGGTLSSSCSYPAAYSATGGSIAVNDGSITSEGSWSLIAAGSGKLNISGGEMEPGVLAHESNTEVSISGGIIKGDVAAGAGNGGTNNVVNISDGTVMGEVSAADGSSVMVSGGLFAEPIAEKYLPDGMLCSTVKGADGYYHILERVTVTFDVDGEKTFENVPKGEKVAKREAPAKENTVFVGWFAEGSDTAYDFETPVTDNLTLTAKWNDNEMKATAGNGEAEETLYFGSGSYVTMTVIASVKEGKLTYEWYRVTEDGDELEAGTTKGEYMVKPGTNTDYLCVVKDEIGNSRTVTYHLVLEERTIALKVGQKVILPDKGDDIRIAGSNCITNSGMTLTAKSAGEATVTVLRNGATIAEYTATVYPDQGITLPAALANLNAAAFLGDTEVKFVTVTGDATITKDAFAGSGLKQLNVLSETFSLPDGFVYDIQGGITVVCTENSNVAAQLSGSAFADANITVVYPAAE